MKTIEIDGKSYLIDIEKATEQGLLKEKDNKPRSWEEYERQMMDIKGFAATQYLDNREYDKFSDINEANAFYALGKLIQLRDAWWGEWRPDWNNEEKNSAYINMTILQLWIIIYMHYIY